MSNAKQILAMLRSKAEGDEEAFFSIALQVAAAEARKGHRQTAEELRSAVDSARALNSHGASVSIPFSQPRGELEGLVEMRKAQFNLKDVVLDKDVSEQLTDFLIQQRKRDWLREHGKTPNKSLLLVGPPGSGKTMSAEALAGELKLPFFVVRLETLITRYMGETAAKLRLVFDETAKRRGVYLFDEFDAVGAHRMANNDVAEMRRVLNSFLQFIEEPTATDSIIICATNYPALLDKALLRRYDLVLEFSVPDKEQIRTIMKSNLKPMKLPKIEWKKIIDAADGLSQSEIVRACNDAVKTAILDERNFLKTKDIFERINQRQKMKSSFLESKEQ